MKMNFSGNITDDDVVEIISDRRLLETLKEIIKDTDYTMEEKYISIEVFLTKWGKEDIKKPTER